MSSFFQSVSYRASDVSSQVWGWFNSFSREEWMVSLVVVCVFGFVCLLGFQARRLYAPAGLYRRVANGRVDVLAAICSYEFNRGRLAGDMRFGGSGAYWILVWRSDSFG